LPARGAGENQWGKKTTKKKREGPGGKSFMRQRRRGKVKGESEKAKLKLIASSRKPKSRKK